MVLPFRPRLGVHFRIGHHQTAGFVFFIERGAELFGIGAALQFALPRHS